MSVESDFIASARKFGAQFKGLLHAADILEDIEKHKNAAREAEARLEALRMEEVQAGRAFMERLQAADGEIIAKHANANAQIAEKHRKADELIDQATEKAARIISHAAEEAAGFANQVEAHHATIAEQRKTIEGLIAEIASHEDFRDQAKADAAVAKQQHANEVAALRAFRASLPQ